MAEVQLQGSSGPVRPGSIRSQQPDGGLTSNAIFSPMISGSGGPGAPSSAPASDNSGYYSTGNPFAVAPVEQDDESDPRRQRYLNDRFGGNQYGGPGMAGRLMTA